MALSVCPTGSALLHPLRGNHSEGTGLPPACEADFNLLTRLYPQHCRWNRLLVDNWLTGNREDDVADHQAGAGSRRVIDNVSQDESSGLRAVRQRGNHAVDAKI